MKRIILIFVIILVCPAVFGQNNNKDAELSSKFIIDLISKVIWPEKIEGNNFTINVVGDNKLVPLLQSLVKSNKSGEENVIINSVGLDGKIEECQMVFIAADSLELLAKILKRVEKKPILTVSMYSTFARYGVMVNIREAKNNEIEYAINNMTTRRSNLIMSDDLIKKAVETYGR